MSLDVRPDTRPDAPPAGMTLQRATNGDGDPGPALTDPRSWREVFSPEGAPGVLLAALFVGVFILEVRNGDFGAWGLSASRLAEGQWTGLFTHMFVHGGLFHLLMNCSALLGLTVVVMSRLGAGRRLQGYARYAGLFLASGLAGAAAYLAVHPTGVVPMVGASGAIFGLWGAAARFGLDGGVAPIRSAEVWRHVKQVVSANVVLFLLISGPVLLSGGEGGLAWESHLGGFLLGLFAGPWFMRQAEVQPAAA
jgi:membrane associated rhomboid family serine protease